MKTKYLYSVNFWVPFPDSEYGGLLNVVAASDEECAEILKLEYESEDSWNKGFLARLEKAVRDAKKFKLSEEHNYDEQKIVMEFTT